MNSLLEADFFEAVHNRERVTGLTHGFYRYPARFSPLFARAAIKAFTKPGDVVLDPFMGGGTTLVEACALGRRAIGADINTLSVFISSVKTTLFSEMDLLQVRLWAEDLVERLNLRNPPLRATVWMELGYQRNINGKSTWPIRKTVELALAQINDLPKEKQQSFARCLILKTAQWALDCRTYIPSAKQFRKQLFLYLKEMIEGAREYRNTVKKAKHLYALRDTPRVLCMNRSVIGIETDQRLKDISPPSLILTSPPYPGVHALYHRWQVQGRRETPAPFWIANSLDGNNESFYTFGERKQPHLMTYFEQAYAAFDSLARIAGNKTLIVQMIAFTNSTWHLPKYISLMKQAGFNEVRFSAFANASDGRIWRCVPNRKWYANQKGAIAASKEVVLFHRLK